jgi:hypothetical protein
VDQVSKFKAYKLVIDTTLHINGKLDISYLARPAVNKIHFCFETVLSFLSQGATKDSKISGANCVLIYNELWLRTAFGK